jgi:dolichol-phosphate mannosyltransferase
MNCVALPRCISTIQARLYKNTSIHVIVPAYNEERFIGQVLAGLPDYVDKIIVIDDCSTDDTFAAATASGDARVLAIKTPHNSGVGGATCLGYRKALELGGEILVKMDGDGQMAAEHLARLLDALLEKGYDYAKGNRFLHRKAISQMPAIRILGNIVLTFLTKAASGYWHIFDPQNGYTAIRSEALRSVVLDELNQRFFFENDMLVQLNIQNYRVADIAAPARYGEELSDLKISKILFTFPPLLLRRFAHRVIQKYILRNFSPVALFLLLGLPMFLLGSLFGLYLWARVVITGEATPTGSIMLALVPIVLGFQLLLQAIVLDIQETPR